MKNQLGPATPDQTIFGIEDAPTSKSMSDAIVSSLTGETVIHANPLGTVTRNCLVIRDEVRGTQIIGIESIKAVRKVNFTNINLLAIAAGCFTIAAAAYASHESPQLSGCIGLLGLLFVLSYFSTRRAMVLCLLDDQSIKSRRGSYREATSIIRAVKRVNASEE